MANHPCSGCKLAVVKLKSPDGGHWIPKCKIYPSQIITVKCADFPLYSTKHQDN